MGVRRAGLRTGPSSVSRPRGYSGRMWAEYTPAADTSSDHTGQVVVTLSRRNLDALMRMLNDQTRPAPALTSNHDGISILVQPQEDDIHYDDRQAGKMSWENGEAPGRLIVQPAHPSME